MKEGTRSFLVDSLWDRSAALTLFSGIGLFFLLFASTASATCLDTLYAFSRLQSHFSTVFTNSDGAAPAGKMVLAGDGNLYGATWKGGANGAGSIFRLSTIGGFTNLYSFPPGTNGSVPSYNVEPNDLVQGSDNNFYGTTRCGGTDFAGTIFVLSPAGAFNTLHIFNNDGTTPTGALVEGGDGNYYGTTQSGGANNRGTIFRITPGGSFTSLYSFPALGVGVVATNGGAPNGLVLGTDGAFYGTTRQGGFGNAGTFFKITESGVFTEFYSFDGDAPTLNPVTPNSTLVPSGTGVFYGMSAFGGSQGGGSIFAITNTGGAKLVYSFPQLNAGADSTLTLSSDGNFYGTIAANGLGGEGTIFRLTPQGQFGDYAFSALDTNSDNLDGADPSGGLTGDSAGNFYGTCAAGGTNGTGLVFEFAGSAFLPPYFVTLTNFTAVLSNLVGSSATLSYSAGGAAALTYQWTRNGTNLTDGSGVSGSATGTLVIDPVLSFDAGTYALQVSDNCGVVTSPETVLTVKPPVVAILSPKAGASISSAAFSGIATSAPLFPGANPGAVSLTQIIYSISNLFGGSNITGMTRITAGANGVGTWSFTATPSAGTNVLSVQSVDASGDLSPVASQTFFFEAAAGLTIVTTGSGTGTFSLPNGAPLDLGKSYKITARPVDSVFKSWTVGVGGSIFLTPTIEFQMQSNLVLTAKFMARRLPAISITSLKQNARTIAPVLEGTATPSPVFPGVNATNVQLTNVLVWVTNGPSTSYQSTVGVATLTPGIGGVSNWVITNISVLAPGTNILAVQAQDISGGVSHVETRTFFYEVPSLFTLTNTGDGAGSFIYGATVPGDAPPTNRAMLNIGEKYRITAQAGSFSRFVSWQSTGAASSRNPTITFIMQSNLVLTANFVQVPPVVSITSPPANIRTTAPPVFSGTASGHFAISNVVCSLGNTNGLATLSAGVESGFNWSIALTPAPGPNTLTVYSVDVNGNQSRPATRKFFYKVPSMLTISNTGTGNGTFHGSAPAVGDASPANGAMLYIGETYKITAIPDAASLFSNWVDSIGNVSYRPALSFVMQSNLVLTATFATNFFPPVAGTYNGLFSSPTTVTPGNAGMIDNFVLRETGAFSGRLLVEGRDYPFSGTFDASGNSSFVISNYSLGLSLNTAIPEITGFVTNGSTADVTLELASASLSSGRYTMLFSLSSNATATLPSGNGYALVSNRKGIVTIAGALADGAHFNETAPLSQGAYFPLYASLYLKSTDLTRGLLLGWLNLTNLGAAYPTNGLIWIKQKQSYRYPQLYTNGFSTSLSVKGAPWIPPADGVSAISLTGGQLIISNTSFSLDYTNVSIVDNKLVRTGQSPTNALSGSINPATGLLTIIFGNGRHRLTDEGFGAVLQDTTNAAGYFVGPTNAGLINLQP